MHVNMPKEWVSLVVNTSYFVGCEAEELDLAEHSIETGAARPVICGSLVNRYTGQVGRWLACPKFLHLRML